VWIRRAAQLTTVGLILATAGTASAALLPRAPSSRLIFDIRFSGGCDSNDCFTDYDAQFTPAGHARFRNLKLRFGKTPGFTRDGHRVAYVERGRLIVASVRTNRQHTLAPHAIAVAPSWSPGGQRIAFARSPGPGGPSFITTIGVDGRGLRQLTQGYEPAWSPRGGIIAFMRGVSGVETLYTVPANGGPAHVLGPGKSPDWSPQGDALAFERDGRIWVAHPDGTHRRELAAGYPVGSMPRFSPDGRQIAFISDNNVYVMDRDGHHKHEIADYSTLPDLDPTGGAEAADVIWLGWQPLLASPTAASSTRQRPEAPRSATARIACAALRPALARTPAGSVRP
jgi:dipeptidyl aminopeptidase/acylaminoacyl peptidase